MDGHHSKQEVAMSKQLEEDALLRMDVSLWLHLIEEMKPDEVV